MGGEVLKCCDKPDLQPIDGKLLQCRACGFYLRRPKDEVELFVDEVRQNQEMDRLGASLKAAFAGLADSHRALRSNPQNNSPDAGGLQREGFKMVEDGSC